MSDTTVPSTGLKGLKENWSKDLLSGFILSLIALPLCLGIASASNFPPAAGLIAAIVGGVLVSRINGSFVTINGPAAGLISVNAAAVMALGHGDKEAGYPLALAAILVSGALIFLLGLLRSGKLAAMVPTNAVHGMLAAIGIIILSKQIHKAIGVMKPAAHEPIPLLAEVPHSFLHMHTGAALIGLVSFLILVVHPLIRLKVIKLIPAPLWVMATAIPLAHFLHLPADLLISLDRDPSKAIVLPSFGAIGTLDFWVAVLSITLVTGLETVLSATAVDRLDPYKRQSNLSRDMGAMGVGTAVSASIGGLPMIAEIVRSSANVANGARTQWSNFFHGIFLAIFMILLVPVINLIPHSALAAMLVYTGLRLASPKGFLHALHLGKDQLAVMIVTVVVTLTTDLLLGIAAGIVCQWIINLFLGSGLRGIFASGMQVNASPDGQVRMEMRNAATFTNFLAIQRQLLKLPRGSQVTLNLSHSRMVDCTVMEHVHEFGRRFEREGGSFSIVGLDGHKPLASHPMAGRVRRDSSTHALRSQLAPRQQALHELAEKHLAYFLPGRFSSRRDLRSFQSPELGLVDTESDRITGKLGLASFELTDLHLMEGLGAGRSGTVVTALILTLPEAQPLPAFTLEPEGFLDDLATLGGHRDIDFPGHPDFSRRWLLRGPDEAAIRNFFTPSLLAFLATSEQATFTVLSDGQQLLIHQAAKLLSASEASQMIKHTKALLHATTVGQPTR